MSDDSTTLQALAHRYGSRDAALAEVCHLEAVLELPKGTIHVVSDVHGEHKKLGHVVRNASGSLRALVESTFGDALTADQKRELLSFVYYARESFQQRRISELDETAREAFVHSMLERMLALTRALAAGFTARALNRVLPAPYEELFRELIVHSPWRAEGYLRALVRPFVERREESDLLRLMSRVVRNLTVKELVVAGDLGDRGPRIDKVIDVLMRQPEVTVVWGNHDASWMGACLGQEALVATVVRLSLRYGRTAQLEEGYGIPLQALELLATEVYGDDPAVRFKCKAETTRAPLLMARMQKAIAVIQFKLEARTAARNPHFQLAHPSPLRRVDAATGEVEVADHRYPMLDASLPTVGAEDPEAFTEPERRCIDQLRESFVGSRVLWEHMSFVRSHGAMSLVRDHHVIFHGCVPVDEAGEALELAVDGVAQRGKALFDALERVVHRAFRESRTADLDWLWYLWTGPRSPLFGKDRMATFETYFVAAEETHKEKKNPYFKLIHDRGFCVKVFAEFGADPSLGLIVNGHVPVKLDAGESPVKQSGMAVTIDGAFSEAYGDKGYTLILDARRTALAQHHHFESVAEVVASGADIVPTVTDLKVFGAVRKVADTEAGEAIRREISALNELMRAYDENVVRPR